MQRNYWSDTFKQYLLKYFIFDSHGNLIDFDRRKRRKQPIDKDGYKTIKINGKQYRFRKLDDAIQLRKENNLPV